jgi:pimeloyl-ACP methyl ester carboxylesterase
MKKEIAIAGNKIAYRLTGKGDTVVLLHGFGEDGGIWDNQIVFLKNKFQLLVPDLPGSGQSELTGDMSMEGMAATIKAILDTEKINSCTLIGHSMGGYITLAFAEKYPQYLEGFGLFHSTAYPDSEEKKNIRRKGITFIRQYGAFEFLKTTSPNLFSENFRKKDQNIVPDFISSLNNFSPEALVRYYEAMIQRPDRTDVLKKTKVPVLFVAGESDSAVPLKDILKQCHLPVLSYFYILGQSGHMGMLEEPDESNSLLEDFLNKINLFRT